MINIRYTDDGGIAGLQHIVGQARNPRQMMLAVGTEVFNQLRTHFQIKDNNQPNKLGGQREHFWNQVRASVQRPGVSSDGLTTTIQIADPRIAQKVFGGDIEAKRAGALTIPETPEAYGRAASTFEQETGLKLVLIRRKEEDRAVLATVAENHQITVEYLLTPRVHQDPDPTALPDQDYLTAVATKRAEIVLDDQIKREGLA